MAGGRVLLKPECLQRTGSFKFRGAYNTIVQLDAAARKRGVIAYSSGNHAQGVAAAAAMLDVPATIVMPADAPRIKIDGTRAWGAELVLYERTRESREAIGAEIARRTGAMLVRPYDEPQVIAGQATVGVEIAEQADDAGVRPAAVVVPCGGGGLTSGIALALSDRWPDTQVFTAEPEGWDDTARSLAAGQRMEVPPGAPSICDALLAPAPGHLTFPILAGLGVCGVTASEPSVKRAMVQAFRHFKLVVEPGGAAALAAVIDGAVRPGDAPVVCVCSGGNVDPALYAAIIEDRHTE